MPSGRWARLPIAVLIEPGQTAFARSPFFAYSTARVRVSARMPALLAP